MTLTMVRLLMSVALTCPLVAIGRGRPKPVGVELIATIILASVARILRHLRWCSPRPLAVVVLVCALLLLIFDATLGYPGEGPAGALPHSRSYHAAPRP